MATQTKHNKIVQELGGAKQIHAGIREFRHRVDLLDARRKELTEKYPDKWVAMADGEIVAIADSLTKMLKELDEKGILRSSAVIEYLDTKRRGLILQAHTA